MTVGALVTLAIASTGCTAGLRGGVGASVDTRGSAGGSAMVAAHAGYASSGGWGQSLILEGFAGGQANPVAFDPGYAVGFDVVHVSTDDELLFRVGSRVRGRWLVGSQPDQTHVGVELVAAGTFSPLRQYHLSIEGRAGVLWDDGFDGSPIGLFTLSLVYDLFTLGDPLASWEKS